MKIVIRKLDHADRENWKQMRQIKNCRLYVHHSGETILENLFDRHNRPYNLYRKVVLPAVVKEMKAHNVVAKDFGWSQYAGCSCPCSPGFRFTTLGASYDVWVTVEATDFEKFIKHVQTELAL